jgi:hypothetical protein
MYLVCKIIPSFGVVCLSQDHIGRNLMVGLVVVIELPQQATTQLPIEYIILQITIIPS